MQEGRGIDFPDEAAGVDQEDLQDVRQLATRPAVATVPRVADVLSKAFDERHEGARGARGEKVPGRAAGLVAYVAAIPLHDGRRVAGGIERQRHELDVAAQA